MTLLTMIYTVKYYECSNAIRNLKGYVNDIQNFNKAAKNCLLCKYIAE